jgi:hypothetical protein
MRANGHAKDTDYDRYAEDEAYDVPEPTPLIRELPQGEPYPLHALGPLRQAAEAIHDLTQAPAAIAAQSVLGVAALTAQALADVDLGHSRAPSSLFLLTVAQSGERKSACDKLAMQAVKEREKELADLFSDEMQEHTNRLAVWEEKRKAILQKCKNPSTSADAYDQLESLGTPPEMPLSPLLVAGDPTIEGLIRNLALSRPSLGIFSDEGGSFIGGHAMNEDNRLKTAAGLSNFWDGKPINRVRAGDGVSVFFGRRLAAHLMVQPVVAAQLLSDPMVNGQGLMARFLTAAPTSTIGTRTRQDPEPGSHRAIAKFNDRIASLLRRPLPLADGRRNELDPHVLILETEARALIREFALATELAQAPGQPLEDTRAFASKAAEHAVRIAAVLSTFEDPGRSTIAAETMCNAITLAGFYIGEARRLSDAALVSSETAEAERMRKWLLDSWTEAHISPTDAAQRGPFKETKRARQALGVLEAYGWLVRMDGGARIHGNRRREAWRIYGKSVR